MYETSQEDLMLAAVVADDVVEVERLLDAGVLVDGPLRPTSAAGDEYRSNALCMAAQNGALKVVRALIARGASVVAADQFGETALHLAAETGSLEAVEALVSAGANIEATNKSGATPLMRAAHRSQIAVLQHLVALDANLGARARGLSNATALHWAAANGKEGVIRVLATAGADINALDEDKESPLHWAVTADRLEAVRVLVDRGADVEIVDRGGRVPLHIAVAQQYLAMCEALVSGGADVGRRSSHSSGKLLAPFHLAVEDGWLEGVRYLAENSDIDPLEKPHSGYAPDSQSHRDDPDMQELLRSLATARSVRLGVVGDVACGADTLPVRTRSLSPI